MIVIPVYNSLIVPDVNIYLKKDIFEKLAGKEAERDEKLLLVITRAKEEPETMDENSFYPIGILGQVKDPDRNEHVAVRTLTRVNLESIKIDEENRIHAEWSNRPDVGDMSTSEQKEHLSRVQNDLMEYLSSQPWGNMAKSYVMQWTSIGEIAVALNSRLRITSMEKYDILAADSIAARIDLMEKAIYEFLEISKVNNEAQSAQEEDHQKVYREAAIKKQMEYLQKELDGMHPENVSDIQKFEKKIEASGMNETARGEAVKVLNRMKQEGNNSPEYGMLYDYLDFVTGLSWEAPEREKIDLHEAEQILEEDHFGLKKVKKRILQQIAVMNLREKQSGSILLFVGAPGTGKTSIGQSIAKALGREYVRVSLGGIRDEAEIRGHRRTYIGAMPGRIMDGISKSKVSNPVMVLDEVDKLAASFSGDPASALLEVLDPEQNTTFTDHYMNVPYDLSNVVFLCTANSVDTIPEPLLNRMEVIQFPGYTATDKFQIAKRHLLPKAQEAMGITAEDLVVEDEAIRRIISDFTMEGGVRGLKKCMDTLCREAAVRLVRDTGEKPVRVTAENAGEFLDAKPIRHDHVLAKKKPGIVTGLAWTAAGGEILFIETLLTKGNGKVIITGQLGDVMKESVQIAISLVKATFPEKAAVFEENDLHVHVPAGAVPKDGPSAGITLTTALASLVTQKAVSPEFAMTGEVSLRGVVMPIGGLPEKLMAAVRSGITSVIIPAENEQDLDEVAQEVKDRLAIRFVKTVQEVLEITQVA